MKVKITRLAHAKDLPLPSYQTEGSAGMDLHAAVEETVVLTPGDFQAIPTGIAVAIPKGFELQVRGRSGLAAKHGVGLVNGIGTIDSDFRGEIHAILVNHGKKPFTISRGDRIAQAILAPFERAEWEEVETLSATPRGAGAFGSTGKS